MSANLAPVDSDVDDEITIDDFVPFNDFVDNHSVWPSRGSARWAVHNSALNGLDDYGAVRRINGRVFFIKPRMLRWMLSKK